MMLFRTMLSVFAALLLLACIRWASECPLKLNRLPVLDMHAVIDALKADLAASETAVLYCPHQAPSSGVVEYTNAQWFQPPRARRLYCQLLVAGRNMKGFLRSRLGCHRLSLAAGRRTVVARNSRVCTRCAAAPLADEKHLISECIALVGLRVRHADISVPVT